MHLRDPATAQVMRRASTGPHALMARRSVSFVPDRGVSFTRNPSRQRLGAISTTQSISSGVSRGATVGSAVGQTVIPIPGVGAAIGAIVGAVAGLVDSAFNRQDPENTNFQQAMAIARANGPEAVLQIQNKYLVLAGLFDLEPGQIKGNIPIYRKYGRMGENRFVHDMINLVYSAAQSGHISANDNAQTVFNRIVQPWIDSFGFGPMRDSNQDMITYILMGMLAEYFANLQHRWFSIGGQNTFADLPPFALPGAVAPTSSATPSPQISTPAPTQSAPAQPAQEMQYYLAGGKPSINSPIGYAPDTASGKFMALPAGGTFAGYTSRGDWIVLYSTGKYTLNQGVLTPYSATADQVTAPSSPVVPPQQTLPSPATSVTPDQKITLTPDPGYNPQMPNPMPPVQYVPTSGGGGGYFPSPSSQTAPAQPSQSASLLGGVSLNTVLMVGGAILALSLLLPHNTRSVRTAVRST